MSRFSTAEEIVVCLFARMRGLLFSVDKKDGKDAELRYDDDMHFDSLTKLTGGVLCLFIFSLVSTGEFRKIADYSDALLAQQAADIARSVSALLVDTPEQKNIPGVQERSNFGIALPIVWEGEITGCLASCWGIAVRRIPENADYPYFQAYIPDDRTPEDYGIPSAKRVRIRGIMSDIDCESYAKTSFGGKCTPIVEIQELEVL